MFFSLLLILVGILWGVTNPFLRIGSEGINKIEDISFIKKFFLEIKFLSTRWKYVVPFLLNQCGSLLYLFVLQNMNLSIAVPIVNSLSFLFTAFTAHLLKENSTTKNTYIGAILITIGSSFCLLDKT